MSRKDLKSYLAHDIDYQGAFNLQNSIKRIEEYDKNDSYTKNGFREAVDRAHSTIDTHIDIGSGNGWLIRKTASIFKEVIAVDPSSHAIEIAKEINKNHSNIEYLTTDMVDTMKTLKFDQPVFITTAIVLSHIKNYYVKKFLELLNDIPTGSMFYFHEPYDTNVQQPLWYIRSKNWWADILNKWELEFKDLPGAYTYGIFGVKVGKNERQTIYKMTLADKLNWFLSGISNKLKRVVRGISKLVLK